MSKVSPTPPTTIPDLEVGLTKDTPCPGCESGTDAETPHIDPKTSTFHTNCNLNHNQCCWCGQDSGKEDFCSFTCMQAEKRDADAASAMADYYDSIL